MIDKLINIYHSICREFGKGLTPSDKVWYGLFILYMFTIIWVMIGAYIHDKELLTVFFWPLNI